MVHNSNFEAAPSNGRPQTVSPFFLQFVLFYSWPRGHFVESDAISRFTFTALVHQVPLSRKFNYSNDLFKRHQSSELNRTFAYSKLYHRLHNFLKIQTHLHKFIRISFILFKQIKNSFKRGRSRPPGQRSSRWSRALLPHRPTTADLKQWNIIDIIPTMARTM